MTDRPWMKFYIGDYLSDTGHLTAAQHGAYCMLIFHYFRRGGLPDEDGQLSRVAAMTPDEWEENRSTIKEFFDDDWRHGRIDREIAAFEASRERSSNNGKKGGRPRKKQLQKPKNPQISADNQLEKNDNRSKKLNESKSEVRSQSQNPDIRGSDSEVRDQSFCRIEGKDPTESEWEKKGRLSVVKGGKSA